MVILTANEWEQILNRVLIQYPYRMELIDVIEVRMGLAPFIIFLFQIYFQSEIASQQVFAIILRFGDELNQYFVLYRP